MPNLLVSATTRYDPKGLNKAKKHITGFEKTVKDMGKIFAGVFSTQKILAFGKASMQAFIADDKAAKVLSRTLTNLGLAFADPSVKTFIGDLEKQYGVLDDFLRPAYQKLLTSTGNLAKSQDLLKTSLDLSAQSGESVVSVANDLARAYSGNTKGLQKYGLGLTKAELAAMSFEEILAKITEISTGQAAAAANTYAGKLDKLEVAAANASETIGGALVDAFVTIAGDGNIDKAIAKIDLLAQSLATLISPTRMKSLFAGVDLKYGLIPVNKPATNYGPAQQSPGERAAAVAYNKKLADQKKKELDISKKNAKSQADLLKLAKAKSVFDMQKIQIEAALKGKISEEDRIRLLLLKAIAEENIDDIEKYTKMLNAVQSKVADLQTLLTEVYAMDAGNPFITWEEGLDGVQRALIEINNQSIELTDTLAQNSLAMGLLGGANFADALSGARYAAQAAFLAAQAGITPTPIVPPTTIVPVTTDPTTITPTVTPTVTTVTVNVAGTVTAQADLEKAIQDAINSSNASGNSGLLTPKTWRAEV
jgi:hypothetical protein